MILKNWQPYLHKSFLLFGCNYLFLNELRDTIKTVLEPAKHFTPENKQKLEHSLR